MQMACTSAPVCPNFGEDAEVREEKRDGQEVFVVEHDNLRPTVRVYWR